MSERYPTTWERFLLWVSRGKQRPTHDCRDYLPRGDTLPAGSRRVCSGCGATNVRYDYDADWGEGTAWFCGWRREASGGAQ